MSKKHLVTIKSPIGCLIEYQDSENKELKNKIRY